MNFKIPSFPKIFKSFLTTLAMSFTDYFVIVSIMRGITAKKKYLYKFEDIILLIL